MRRLSVAIVILLLHQAGWTQANADERAGFVLADAAAAENKPNGDGEAGNKSKPSPEESMQRRFPQPIRVGDLVGLPVLDDQDSTIGYVQSVVRTADGKVHLLVPYSERFGWLQRSPWSKRVVAVPIEKVAILGRQVAAIDMPREDFDKALAWTDSQGNAIAPDDSVKIAITRR